MTSSQTNILCLCPPRADVWLVLGLRVLSSAGVVLLLLIVGCLVGESYGVLSEVGPLRLFSDASWHPTEHQFGLAPMAWASLLSSLGAVALAAPLGLGAAIYARFYSGPVWCSVLRQLLGVFAGIPSVVFGFWGLTTLVPLVNDWQPPGASLLAGSLVLALMMLPTVALTSLAALQAVPPGYFAAAHALGMRRGTLVLKVGVSAARHGIWAGLLLALARALGETMAMLMVSGNIVQIPSTMFDAVRSLAANIALEMAYAAGLHRSALYACGMVLIAVVALATLLAERLNPGASRV